MLNKILYFLKKKYLSSISQILKDDFSSFKLEMLQLFEDQSSSQQLEFNKLLSAFSELNNSIAEKHSSQFSELTKISSIFHQYDESSKVASSHSYYLGDGEILVKTKQFNLIVPGWDLSLTPSILLFREWESGLSNYFLERVCPGMIALDVGANIGWFASLFASKGAFVHAFEPNPRLQKILKKNIFLNAGGNTPKCSVNACAVGESCWTTKMKFPHWLLGGAGLHDFDQSTFLDSLIENEIEIPVVSLDEFTYKNGIDEVDFIKIDIEGYEEQAVTGAKKLISRSRNLTLTLEFTKGKYSNAFISFLFENFSHAYLPLTNDFIDLQFLTQYNQGLIYETLSHIDVVFSK